MQQVDKPLTAYNIDVANTDNYLVRGTNRPDAGAVWAHNCNAKKSLKEQAADLVPANSNKNRVTLRSQHQQLEIDLEGKAHNGVPTPHTKVSGRNHGAPDKFQPAYNTSEKKSILRDATQEDIRTARRYLERRYR